jgi:carboxyl-terminal processing protease
MYRFTLALLCAAAALPAADDLASQMKSVVQAYSILEQNAADPVSSEQAFYQGAIPGLLRRLDPHSVFFDPDQFEQLKRMESSTQKGFGSVVSLLPGRVIVLQTLPGTPSAKSGLAPGDEIVGINGYIISRLDLDQLTQLLGQSRQQQAQLEVRRGSSGRLLHFVLTPEEMQAPSVDRAFFLGAGIGYVRAGSFDEHTAADLKQAIEKLGGDRLAGLVLDLRNNPGGMVNAAIDTASLFLQPGTRIVTVRGRHVPEKSEAVPSIAKPYGFKLAILINEKTASASEIVSGALQDHDRATIIGTSSFGKGLVQSVFPMTQNTALALTTALYYTPSGRSIQKPLDASKFELAATTAHPTRESEFHTDKGRKVTGAFTNFATDYLRTNKVTGEFEVTPQIVAQFQVFVSERGIQPGVSEWSVERDFVANRLKTEIFNQAFGVEKGDEVEAQRDPVILKALEVFGG